MSKSQEKKIKLKPKSSYNNEYSNLTKIPKRPIVIIPKTPEEVAQEIEGLRMHMADKAKELEDLGDSSIKPNGLFDYLKPELPPVSNSEECPSDNIPVSDIIMKKAIDEASKSLLSQMERLTPISEAYLVSKKLDRVLNEIKTERQFEQIYNESKSNHFKERNEWLDQKEYYKSRIFELENLLNLEYQKSFKLRDDLEKLRMSNSQDFIEYLNLKGKVTTLEKKIAAKNDFIKELQDEKFEIEVDLEEVKESYDTLKFGFTELQNHSDEQHKKIIELKKEVKTLEFARQIEDNVRIQYLKEIDSLKELLLSAQCSYKSSQKLLQSTCEEFQEYKDGVKDLEFRFENVVKKSNEKDLEIFSLCLERNELRDKEKTKLANKIKSFFIANLNASKSNGTLYFAIWLVIWFFCLFTLFNFIV